jgi:integrase
MGGRKKKMKRQRGSEFVVSKAGKPNGRCSWYISGRPGGRRIRAWFETKEAATVEANERNQKMRQLGEVAVTLDHSLIGAVMTDAALLAPYGKTVHDAVVFYLAHLKNINKTLLGKDFCDKIRTEFDRRLRDEETSSRHEQTMREVLRKFESQYGDANIAALTPPQIAAWLNGTGLSVRSKNKYVDYLKNAFNVAVTRLGILDANPLKELQMFNDPNGRSQNVSIFSPEQLQAFLNTVRVDYVPYFAIQAFTGLRNAEVTGQANQPPLDWSEIKLDRRIIDLPPSKSKNRRRKLIEVSDNLYAWLKPHEKESGPVLPFRFAVQEVREKACEKANIEKWPQNVLRHSFCSFAVAAKGLVWTAIQADHSERQLKDDYWEMVTKEEAERYWAIKPNV